MRCKNCGAELPEHAKVCPNCGPDIQSAKDYVLLSDFDDYSDHKKKNKVESIDRLQRRKRKRNNTIFIVFTVIVLVASAVLSYMYFSYQNSMKEIPVLEFTSGSGIIDDDKKVVYASFTDSSSVEFIHGVTLYNASEQNANKPEGVAISTDYDYTKSIDNSFRVVLFDMDKLEFDSASEQSWLFEIKVSFYEDENIYTYYQPVSYKKDAADTDVGDIVFDHSLADRDAKTKPETTAKKEKATEPGTSSNPTNTGFIYNSFWFSAPIRDGDNLYITAYQFRQNGSCVTTQYTKEGTADWAVSTSTISYKIDGNKLTISDSESNSDDVYSIDSANNTITLEDDSQAEPLQLQARRYNSIKNAEDFFGI